MNNFGKRLRKLRKRNGLTQIQLADVTGLSSQQISNYEREYTSPNQQALRQLAQGLRIDMNDLVGGTEVEVNYEMIMFSDKKGFDELPLHEQKRILNNLQEQADFLVERAKKMNQND
ncbi:helix-turn-helix domain-containing protein [Staphylococcus pettenkoferi]|uniref:helix-turn-helix domain-containing protein n=1 Tax=Staphylococcus pettenkoferi TaxID=170573 RepID=UPI00119D9737|nr:helix-turn-helix transcriptional regulator [Staphylococcus pettenkoferi]MCY1563871.1 helix-turn-helix domain-containing protein [Staphylococcus pettenkoferi]